MSSPVSLGVSPTNTPPHWFSQPEVLRLSFPTLESWAVRCASLPSCSSQFIHSQMWDHLSASCCLAMGPLCCGYQSLPVLPVWMNVSSLTSWLQDFNTVGFSDRSGCFSFLNLLLSFFLLYEEAKCIYLCLHLGQTDIKNIFEVIFLKY